MVFILRISVLYFIKKINTEYIDNAANINNNGSNIDAWIVVDEVILMLAGWCKVGHQSTENLITGKLIKPIIAIKDANLFDNSKFGISF